jgi:hypothetical protein
MSFLYHRDGTYTTLDFPGHVFSTGINNLGQIVGQMVIYPEGGFSHAVGFIATPLQNSPLGYVIEKAKEDLARRLSIAATRIDLIEAAGIVWPNSCLGCPQPEMACAQVLTDGYRIQLEFEGTVYEYHSDTGTHFVYCENPTSPTIPQP